MAFLQPRVCAIRPYVLSSDEQVEALKSVSLVSVKGTETWIYISILGIVEMSKMSEEDILKHIDDSEGGPILVPIRSYKSCADLDVTVEVRLADERESRWFWMPEGVSLDQVE